MASARDDNEKTNNGSRAESTPPHEGAAGPPMTPAMTPGASPARRSLLKVAALACGAAAIATMAVPAVYVLAPDRRAGNGGRWIRTLHLDALPDGEPTRVVLIADVRDAWTLAKDQELGAVWLLRKGEAVTALSAVCPHLGCAIDARKGAPGFACPCHDSDFGAAGERLTGPSPRGMDPLATRLEDGYVMVDFREYRQGSKERVEVG